MTDMKWVGTRQEFIVTFEAKPRRYLESNTNSNPSMFYVNVQWTLSTLVHIP